jgi:hypothetical protein
MPRFQVSGVSSECAKQEKTEYEIFGHMRQFANGSMNQLDLCFRNVGHQITQ